MRNILESKGFLVFAALTLTFILGTDAFSQGRGRGNSGGNPGAGQGGGGDRGMGGAGFPDMSGRGGWENPRGRDGSTSETRGGRSGSGGRRERPSNPGPQRFEGLSNHLGVPASELQSQYEAARAENPNLTYGQWVAANVIGISNPRDLTAEQILGSLRDGKTLGETLSSAGWDRDRIKKERKRIKKEVGDDEDGGYEEDKDDWR